MSSMSGERKVSTPLTATNRKNRSDLKGIVEMTHAKTIFELLHLIAAWSFTLRFENILRSFFYLFHKQFSLKYKILLSVRRIETPQIFCTPYVTCMKLFSYSTKSNKGMPLIRKQCHALKCKKSTFLVRYHCRWKNKVGANGACKNQHLPRTIFRLFCNHSPSGLIGRKKLQYAEECCMTKSKYG